MSRAWFALAVAAVLGLFYVGYGLQSSSPGLAGSVAFGQEVRPPVIAFGESSPGRFQMAVMDGAASGTRPYLFVCDTATGECWSMSASTNNHRWNALGNPRAVQAEANEAKPAGKAADAPPKLTPPK